MTMEVKNLKRMTAGTHQGIITGVSTQEVDFKQGNGPESSLVVVIQPAQPKDGGVFSPLSVNFTPSLNPLSAWGELLVRINKAPDFANAKTFEETSVIGTEILFDVAIVNGFPRVQKASIRAL